MSSTTSNEKEEVKEAKLTFFRFQLIQFANLRDSEPQRESNCINARETDSQLSGVGVHSGERE